MTMGDREDRLYAELERMNDLRHQSGFIDFEVKSDPPDEYTVIFTCRGMVDIDEYANQHVARIYLPAGFPYEEAPQVRFLTPSFHPNIAALIQMTPIQAKIQDLLRRAPDEDARRRVKEEILADEDMFLVKVCLDTLDENWSPAITLDRICIELGEMIQYKRYNVDSPLNQMAAMWAVANAHKLPIDSRSLLDLRALAGIRILDQSELGPDDLDIRFAGEGRRV
jgi:ubiquitin-protein ligase